MFTKDFIRQYSSDISSPLTSLSSLADIDEASNLRNKHKRPHDAIDDTVEVAEVGYMTM